MTPDIPCLALAAAAQRLSVSCPLVASQHRLVCLPAHCLPSAPIVMTPHALQPQTDYIDILILRALGSQSNTPLEEVMQGMKVRAHGRLARAQPTARRAMYWKCGGTVSGVRSQLPHCQRAARCSVSACWLLALHDGSRAGPDAARPRRRWWTRAR
jgi:hypothetical protein